MSASTWAMASAWPLPGVTVVSVTCPALTITVINAARIALRGDGRHFVSLDKAINTMRVTGRDMLDKYKETSRGGLAVNVIEC